MRQAADSSDEFAAAQDSSSDDEEQVEGAMQLGNVVTAHKSESGRQGEAHAHSSAPHAGGDDVVQLPTFQFASKRRQRLDGRPLLLFDVNGVLMQHRWDGVSHHHDLRPGVHHLLRLVPHFRLGIYSSATRPTITKALGKLQNNLANFLEQRRQRAQRAQQAQQDAEHAQQREQQQRGQPAAVAGASPGAGGKRKRASGQAEAAAAPAAAAGAAVDVFPAALPLPELFEIVMARDHCQPASRESIEARGGRPWDTVKPLSNYFASLDSVLLVDDSAHKADGLEAANMLVMPCWHGAQHPLGRSDASLPLLVDALLRQAGPAAAAAAAAAAGPEALDLRRVTASISQQLAAAAARQLEDALAAGQLSADEAAAATAMVEAAAAGSAAVAAAVAQVEAGGFEAASPELPEPAVGAQQQQEQEQRPTRKRPLDDAAAEAEAGEQAVPAAGTEAAAAAGASQQMSKKQRRMQIAAQQAAQLEAAKVLLLAAAAQVEAGKGGSGGSGSGECGLTMSDINAYMVSSWPGIHKMVLGGTAKAAVADALKAGLIRAAGPPAAAAAPAAAGPPAAAAGAAAGAAAAGPPAAAAGAAGASPKAGGKKSNASAAWSGPGKHFQLTPAGSAAAASQQYMADLAAYCQQYTSRSECLAGLNSHGKQEQQQQQPGKSPGKQKPVGQEQAAGTPAAAAATAAGAAVDGGEDVLSGGFFWERQTQSPQSVAQPARQRQQKKQKAEQPVPQQQQPEQQPEQLPQQPEAPAQQQQPAAAAPPGPPPPPVPPGPAAQHAQQGVLLHAMSLLQQRRGFPFSALEHWVDVRLPSQAPPGTKEHRSLLRTLRVHLQLALAACEKEGTMAASRPGPGAPLQLLACHRTPAAPAAPAAAQLAVALQTMAEVLGLVAPAAAAATAAAAERQPEPSAAAEQQPEPALGAAAEAAGGSAKEGVVPMLLDVFEDRAPPPAAAAAAVSVPAVAPEPAAAATAVPALSAAGAAVATPAIEEAQQQLEELQQQLADAQRQRDLRLRQARQDVALLPKGERKARLMLLEAAELTGLPVEKLAAMEPPQVQAVARKARKAAKKQSRAATAKLRKLARVAGGGAAGAVLDKLFAAAASGKDPVWRQACAALSGKERKALAAAGVDLESYRRQIAERAAGGTAASSEEDSDGDGDEQGEEEAVEEAAAAAAAAGSAQQQQQQDEAATEAAVAAHGGHFLRSCDASSPASASAAAAGQQEQDPLWFWERSQRQQRGAADPAASPQQQQQRVPGSLSGGGSSRLSPLHYEVEAFAARATPTVAEANAVQQAVLAIDAAARSLWPHSRTALFGSQATGLALPGSDLDIVVLGVGATLARAGTGFTKVQRKQQSELLEDLLDELVKRKLLRGKAEIIEARVPIIKCKLDVGNGLAADLTLGAENGAAAVDFVRRQVLAVPPLRPLCLAIKAFLREHGRNEVFTGGLSSYSIFNMVMAHLQQEGYKADTSLPQQPKPVGGRGDGRGGGRGGGGRGRGAHAAPPADLQQTLYFLQQLVAGGGAAPAPHPSSQQQGQQQHRRWQEVEGQEVEADGAAGLPADLGVLLWGFFDRFGNRFSYSKHAVSIRMGGVCMKTQHWRKPSQPWLLAVEDPQEMGRDIASGSKAMREIKEAFAAAAEQLAEVCEDYEANDPVAAGAAGAAGAASSAAAAAASGAAAAAAAAGESPAAAQQAGGSQVASPPPQQQRQTAGSQLLQGVLDVEAAVGRSADALRSRQSLEQRAAAKSAQVLHERIRSGVIVGTQPRGPQLPDHLQGRQKHTRRQARVDAKVEKRRRQAEANEAYHRTGLHQKKGGGGRGGGAGGRAQTPAKRLGSRKTQAVEAQWGSQRGTYKDQSAEDEGPAWSLRQQKKPKAKRRQSDGGGGGGGSAKKKKKTRKG